MKKFDGELIQGLTHGLVTNFSDSFWLVIKHRHRRHDNATHSCYSQHQNILDNM